MGSKLVTTAKFIGTISLGLLTVGVPRQTAFRGLSYTLSTITIPALLSLPSAASAHVTFQRILRSSAAQLKFFSALSYTSFVFAFLWSPRRGKHPYLVWTAATVGLSVCSDAALRYVMGKEDAQRSFAGYEDVVAWRRKSFGMFEDVVAVEDADLNGEELERGMAEFRKAQAVRGGIAGLGFLMSIVGIWGDGY